MIFSLFSTAFLRFKVKRILSLHYTKHMLSSTYCGCAAMRLAVFHDKKSHKVNFKQKYTHSFDIWVAFFRFDRGSCGKFGPITRSSFNALMSKLELPLFMTERLNYKIHESNWILSQKLFPEEWMNFDNQSKTSQFQEIPLLHTFLFHHR